MISIEKGVKYTFEELYEAGLVQNEDWYKNYRLELPGGFREGVIWRRAGVYYDFTYTGEYFKLTGMT